MSHFGNRGIQYRMMTPRNSRPCARRLASKTKVKHSHHLNPPHARQALRQLRALVTVIHICPCQTPIFQLILSRASKRITPKPSTTNLHLLIMTIHRTASKTAKLSTERDQHIRCRQNTRAPHRRAKLVSKSSSIKEQARRVPETGWGLDETTSQDVNGVPSSHLDQQESFVVTSNYTASQDINEESTLPGYLYLDNE